MYGALFSEQLSPWTSMYVQLQNSVVCQAAATVALTYPDNFLLVQSLGSASCRFS
jgi:hypothetical protein